MEKLEKEGIVFSESSPVNTDENQEEELHYSNFKRGTNTEKAKENLNVEMEKEQIANEIKNDKNKRLENKKIVDELTESIFISTAVKKGNRISLFRGDIFDLEVEGDKKVF